MTESDQRYSLLGCIIIHGRKSLIVQGLEYEECHGNIDKRNMRRCPTYKTFFFVTDTKEKEARVFAL